MQSIQLAVKHLFATGATITVQSVVRATVEGTQGRGTPMNAVTVSEYGADPTVSQLPDPEPSPDQLLIKILAAGVNPMDSAIANGQWQSMMPAKFPMILGADFAGVVETVGEHSTHFSVGDQVFGQLLIPPLGSVGTYAERVAVSEDAPLARIPAGLEPAVAAALPTTAGTAVNLIDTLGSLANQTVLIVGAGGGVGSFLTQLAARSGARVIASTRARDDERVRSYGAVETVDFTVSPLLETVCQAHPGGIDVLIDLASDAKAFATLATSVRPGGIAVSMRFAADHDALVAAGVEGINFRVSLSTALLNRVGQEVVEGRLIPPPVTTVKLSDAPGTLNGNDVGRTGSKVVIIP